MKTIEEYAKLGEHHDVIHGGHRMTNAVLREVIVPLVRKLLLNTTEK
ncbi:hypothetical protein [Prevotella sp. P6B1]|nr:hypothetical protein [Prevotella sp. P6B1]